MFVIVLTPPTKRTPMLLADMMFPELLKVVDPKLRSTATNCEPISPALVNTLPAPFTMMPPVTTKDGRRRTDVEDTAAGCDIDSKVLGRMISPAILNTLLPAA